MLFETDQYVVWQAIRAFYLGFFTFIFAFLLIPKFTDFIYRHQLWRKKEKDLDISGKKLSVFHKFHAGESTSIPRVGGLIVWVIPLLVAFLFWLFGQMGILGGERLNFVSRSQTWLPLFALGSASILGLVDDLMQIRGKGKYAGGGLRLSWRIGIVALIGLIGGWWFYFKLGVATIGIPGLGGFFVGWWLIPIFAVVMMATYSGGVIDGLDGLSGGTFASIFAAFAAIAFFNLQYDLAAFCLVLVGAILSFLWFNIPPARFYLGETGIIGLCATLTVVAFLTDSLVVLPIIAFLLVIESGSVIIQVLSKKIFKKKVFLAAPIHHHFEAKEWPHYKVTMRFWVIGSVMALIGVAIRLLG
jgi:phospho-N-acetylmuramoyl-pentapeptide-transferase